MEVPAHDVDRTVDCRVAADCRKPAPARGRYAGRCEDHRDQPAREPREPKPAGPSSTSLEKLAKAIVPAARKLERSARAKRAATVQLKDDVAAFSESLTALRDAAQQLIA